jgi:ligand-binding sensor domain-containing protein
MSVAPTVQGREFKYLNFSSKEGLAGDNIYSITQDKDGFIWIATGTGLSRFDGTAFKNFTTEDGLPSNDIILVKRDSKNRIWIFPFKDEVCYYYKGRIYNKHNDSTLKKMPPLSETKQMAEDAAGRIMIITPNLYVVINTDNTLSTFTRPNTGSFTFNPVSANIFIEQEIWDTAAWSDYRYKSYNCSDYGGTGISKYALQSPSHLIAYDKYHKVIFSKRDFPTARNSYGLISDTILVANTADGSHLYNIYNNQYDHLLKGYPVAYTFIDNESGIWLGTRGMGVFYLSPYRNFSLSGTAEDKPLQAYNFYVTREHLIVGNSHSQFRYLDKDNYSLGKLINNDAITAEMLYPTRGNLLKCSEVGIGSILKKHQISEHAIKTIAVDHDTLIVATVSDLQKVVLRNKKNNRCLGWTDNSRLFGKRSQLCRNARRIVYFSKAI